MSSTAYYQNANIISFSHTGHQVTMLYGLNEKSRFLFIHNLAFISQSFTPKHYFTLIHTNQHTFIMETLYLIY